MDVALLPVFVFEYRSLRIVIGAGDFGMRKTFFALIALFAAAWPAAADDANALQARCLAVAQANHGATPGSTHKQLAPHQLRMRRLCAEWRTLGAAIEPGKAAVVDKLAERCLVETQFDLARTREPAFDRHVRKCAAITKP
jgi:hypothetical protein